jgi:hypothetical protein
LVKVTAVTATAEGDIQTDTTVGGYRKEGDILWPHKMTVKAGPMEFAMSIETVQHNPEIPKDKFELPSEVKALLTKAK